MSTPIPPPAAPPASGAPKAPAAAPPPRAATTPPGPPPSPSPPQGPAAAAAPATPTAAATTEATDTPPEGVESGPSLQEAGQGAARAAAQRNAQHIVDGDLVGRDKFVFQIGGRRRSALRRLSPLLFERVQQAFVEPDGWMQLRSEVDRRRIVVLQGEPGSGRTATAVRLLHSLGVEVIYDLDPHVDLARLTEQLDEDGASLPGSAGLLLCQPPREALQGRALRDLETVLAPGQRLTLVVGPEARLGDGELMEYLVPLPGRPDLHRILEQHLEWRLRSYAAVRRLLDDEDVAALVTDVLQEFGSCEDAALLALVLSEEAEGVDPERVRDRMSRRGLDAFDQWFDGLPDNVVRSFAIALAVLDGLPYEDVARASTRLARRLAARSAIVVQADGAEQRTSSQPTSASQSAAQQPSFRFPRRRLLELTRSEVVEGEVARPYGRVPAQLVAFKDRSYPRSVIDHVWFEHQIHDAFLDWLVEVAHDPSDLVRVQVATTLGVLATGSFHHVLTSVIAPWADGKSTVDREAAAYALRVPGSDPRLAPAVQQLVRTWLGDGEGSRLRATGVRALGLLVAADVEPVDQVLTWFDGLAVDPTWQLQQEMGAAFCDLLEADPVRFATPVLGRLIRWVDDPRRADTGRLTFLIVAHDLVTEQTTIGGGLVMWPSLLRLATDAREQRENLVHLWCRVLGDGPHAEIAEAVLSGWAERAERDADIRTAFARLVRTVGAASSRAGVILARCARLWRGDGEAMPLPQVAHIIELVLSSGEGRS